MSFLPKATDFTDMEKKSEPDHQNRDHVCPVCDGYGGWNLTLNAYGEGQHFRSSCAQCWGWGWVKEKDAVCIHERVELTQQESRALGVTHYGMCYHVKQCTKCGDIISYDSSG